ncbi:hypothetical protein CJF30_00001029 [Rutstroemia sp. NJR-2017a BBW]|nr:hypothetical protein CJF30_00001029 [Rutstroemia sp. NJR-2017a BBW]
MAPNNGLGDAERAEEIGATVQGTALPNEPAESSQKSTREKTEEPTESESTESHTSSASSIANPEDEARDLEQLAPVASAPLYSTFGIWKKRYIVGMCTLAAFLSPTSANIYFPALNPLAAELGVSNTLINLTLTSYMIFQGLAPTIFGDLADMAGRRPVYIIAFVIYLGANISTGSSGAIALGYGVVADVSTSAERGTYVGIVGAGTMLGPALAPVIGGILTQFLGWRSIFWFLTVKIIAEKDVAMVLFYNALLYTAFYDVTASLPELFEEIYDFNNLEIGLCYLPFGVGCCLASIINGRMLDRNYKKIAKEIGFAIDRKRGDSLRNFPIERARLEIIWPLLTVGLSCYLCYGWVLEKNANLAAPLILQFLMGLCINGAFNILSTLVVDLYPQSPSTATAANNLVRCFMGAGGTGIISIMVKHMGRGWCFTFIALYGPKWREERMVRMDKQAEQKKLKEEEAAAAATKDETTKEKS